MFNKVLNFYEFIAENATKPLNLFQKGLDFTKSIKAKDDAKPQYKHMPCYEYVYNFIKLFKPAAPTSLLQTFKMAYKKDIQSLSSVEALKLAVDSLQVPSQPETMRGLEYANQQFNLGNIVNVDQAKVGDAISFWVYTFIEFSRKEKNYSFKDTEAKFNAYIKNNKIKPDTLPEWLIEGIKVEYGHYGIISEIDVNYFYLSSSGEKNGCNGIWNGVSKSECSENFTKIPKADIKKFQKMKYDDFLFKNTDTLTNRKVQVILRSYILSFTN